MKWLPQSLMGRNFLLLVLLILAGQVLSAMVLRELVQKPAIVRLAATLANNLVALEAGIRALPADSRARFVGEFNAKSRQFQQTEVSPLPFPAQRLLMREISSQLGRSQGEMIWRREEGDAFFFRLNVDGQSHWLYMAGMQSGPHAPRAGLLSWGLGMVLAIVGAYLIQRRINKPLAILSVAAGQVGRGEAMPPLAEDGPQEIAEVCKSFNQMRNQLTEQENQRSLMLAGVSHDLRTPLTKIRMAAALWQDEVEQQSPYNETIARACGDIESIIRQFIDFAGIGSSEKLEVLDINKMLTELAGLQPQPFRLVLQSLPAIRLRPVAVRRIFQNLLDNAVRYGAPEFSIATRREGSFVVVSISDQGSGIPAERIAEMLKPFNRGSAARHGPSGSGLGLAIAERLATLEGGGLRLQSAIGGGLQVEVRLPLVEANS